MRTITAEVQRGTGWWVVEVPEIEGLLSQAKRLEQVEVMVKDAAQLLTGEPAESFEVRVVLKLSADVQAHLDAAARLFDEAKTANRQAAEESRAAARELARVGLSMREIGQVLGVSHQRAHQLMS